MDKVSIVFICDDGFVMQTATAITSAISNKYKNSFYDIYVVCSNVSIENKKQLESIKSKNCNIIIKNQDIKRFHNLHQYREGGYLSATESALLKFDLPQILSHLDKVLYLDGDTIIQGDLNSLYSIDLENYLCAAACDSGTIYFKHEYALKYPKYFNSGVMLLNLKRLRDLNISETLIETKKNINDRNLMDQNVFNIVFDKQVKFIDIRWNLLIVNLERAKKNWNIHHINELFNSNYKDFKDLKSNAVIIHFSSKDKPWKYFDTPYSKLWYKYYKKSPFKNKKLNRIKLHKKVTFLERIFSIKNDDRYHKIIQILGIKIKFINKYKKLNSRIDDILKNKDNSQFITERLNWTISQSNVQNNTYELKVSVIIPVYNAEQYLEKCINSVLSQTLKDIEIICVDDCSNDSSLSILKKYKQTYNNFVLISQEHQKQGAARNKGLEIARGKYITFVDADDYLDSKMLEELYRVAETFNAELAIGHIYNYFIESSLKNRTEDYQNIYDRQVKAQCYNPITVSNFNSFRVGPVAKLYRKDIIDKYSLKFPENLYQEDEAFYWYYMSKIWSVHFVKNARYNRLIHFDSVMYKKDNVLKNHDDHLIICKLIYEHLKYWHQLDIYKDLFCQYSKRVIDRSKVDNSNPKLISETQEIINMLN